MPTHNIHKSEWKEKTDLVDNEEEDTVSFDMKNTFIFRPDLTKGLTGNEVVTIPHLLIMVSRKSSSQCYKIA